MNGVPYYTMGIGDTAMDVVRKIDYDKLEQKSRTMQSTINALCATLSNIAYAESFDETQIRAMAVTELRGFSKQQPLTLDEIAVVEQYLADITCPECRVNKNWHRPGCSQYKGESAKL